MFINSTYLSMSIQCRFLQSSFPLSLFRSLIGVWILSNEFKRKLRIKIKKIYKLMKHQLENNKKKEIAQKELSNQRIKIKIT
jgi:hypothetical protein